MIGTTDIKYPHDQYKKGNKYMYRQMYSTVY